VRLVKYVQYRRKIKCLRIANPLSSKIVKFVRLVTYEHSSDMHKDFERF
jgi:hypothetical protein